MVHTEEKCRYCKYFHNPDGKVKILYHDNICCVVEDKFRKRLLVVYKNHFLAPPIQKDDIHMVLIARKFGDIDPKKGKTIKGHYIIQVIPEKGSEAEGNLKGKKRETKKIQKDM